MKPVNMVTQMEKTLHITDQELHSTLNEFLEEKEKKPAESIWNFSTIMGLVLVFTSAAFVGHTVGSELFGFGSLPFIDTLIGAAPYIGGAVLTLIILSMFTRSKKEKIQEAAEQEKIKETYDKLDEFLYRDVQNKGGKSKSSRKSHDSFNVNTAQRLMKSRTDKKIAGVCGGLAKHLGISSTVMRFIFVAAVFLSSSTFILVYIAMAFVMPKEPVSEMDDFK
jgi:phage shock protein C